MKNLFQNEVSGKDNSIMNGLPKHRVNVTHILNDLSPEPVKFKILDILAGEKGKLEIKGRTVTLCFWTKQDKEDFLVILH